MDIRDSLISRVVRGHSFADVGGLWGTVNEKVSVAARAGAMSLAMIDISKPASPLWDALRERLASHHVENCDFIAADICELSSRVDRPRFEVVHCSGILYHHPNPIMVLVALRRITRMHLILTSAITQEFIENKEGNYRISESGVLFVPALSEIERRVLSEYWRTNAGVENALGITLRVHWDTEDLAPWWWLPTRGALEAMCRASGLEVLEAEDSWNGNAPNTLMF